MKFFLIGIAFLLGAAFLGDAYGNAYHNTSFVCVVAAFGFIAAAMWKAVIGYLS